MVCPPLLSASSRQKQQSPRGNDYEYLDAPLQSTVTDRSRSHLYHSRTCSREKRSAPFRYLASKICTSVQARIDNRVLRANIRFAQPRAPFVLLFIHILFFSFSSLTPSNYLAGLSIFISDTLTLGWIVHALSRVLLCQTCQSIVRHWHIGRVTFTLPRGLVLACTRQSSILWIPAAKKRYPFFLNFYRRQVIFPQYSARRRVYIYIYISSQLSLAKVVGVEISTVKTQQSDHVCANDIKLSDSSTN